MIGKDRYISAHSMNDKRRNAKVVKKSEPELRDVPCLLKLERTIRAYLALEHLSSPDDDIARSLQN